MTDTNPPADHAFVDDEHSEKPIEENLKSRDTWTRLLFMANGLDPDVLPENMIHGAFELLRNNDYYKPSISERELYGFCISGSVLLYGSFVCAVYWRVQQGRLFYRSVCPLSRWS